MVAKHCAALAQVIDADSPDTLDRILKDAAEQAGYFRVLLESWDEFHYGAHAGYARNYGMQALAVLLAAGWQISHRVLDQPDPELRASERQRIGAEFADEYSAAASGLSFAS
ncbi:MAG: hypothetical protein ACK50G_00715 [bacterium]|jgi:hypothetical protein